MTHDEIDRMQICEEAVAVGLNYEVDGKEALKWHPAWPTALKRKKEKDFKFQFALFTKPADYLTSGRLLY